MGGNTQQLRQLCGESGGSGPSKIEATSHVLFPTGEDGRTRPDRTRVRDPSLLRLRVRSGQIGMKARLKNMARSQFYELLSKHFTKCEVDFFGRGKIGEENEEKGRKTKRRGGKAREIYNVEV